MEMKKKTIILKYNNLKAYFHNYFLFSKTISASLGNFLGPIIFGPSILPLSVRKLYFNITLCKKNLTSFIASCLPGHLNNLTIICYFHNVKKKNK
jgi:hypothetical protein